MTKKKALSLSSVISVLEEKDKTEYSGILGVYNWKVRAPNKLSFSTFL
jgi:hypothetical protein